MGQHSDTEAVPRFWVVSLEASIDVEGLWEFKALQFDEFYGLGDRHAMSFEGEVAYLKGQTLVLGRVELARGHATRSGYFHTLKTAEPHLLPSPPFLLTGGLDTRCLLSGEIMVEPNSDSAEYIASLEIGEGVPVGSSGWFGVATLKSRGSTVFDLVAFGTGTHLPSEGQELVQLDTDEPFGRISMVERGLAV